MDSRGKQICEKIMTELTKQGINYKFPYSILLSAIRDIAGLDRRTIRKYVEALECFGYIEKLDEKTWIVKRGVENVDSQGKVS